MTSDEKELAHVDSLAPSDQQATGGQNKATPTTTDVLRQAADLIERNGWWNGNGPADETNCATMAIAYAAPFGWTAVCERAMRQFLQVDSLATWNDAQQNGAVVIAALRACADSLEVK